MRKLNRDSWAGVGVIAVAFLAALRWSLAAAAAPTYTIEADWAGTMNVEEGGYLEGNFTFRVADVSTSEWARACIEVQGYNVVTNRIRDDHWNVMILGGPFLSGQNLPLATCAFPGRSNGWDYENLVNGRIPSGERHIEIYGTTVDDNCISPPISLAVTASMWVGSTKVASLNRTITRIDDDKPEFGRVPC